MRNVKKKNKLILITLLLNTGCLSSTSLTKATTTPTKTPGTSTTGVVATTTTTVTTAPTSTPTSAPTVTPSASPTIVSTATNSDHTCSIMSDTSIECSGTNTYLQAPASITSINQPQQIIVGGTFSCATDVNMYLWCWGQGLYLGVGSSQANTAIPVATLGPDNEIQSGIPNQVLSVSAYGTYACAVPQGLQANEGNLYCWGYIGSSNYKYIPTIVNTGSAYFAPSRVFVANNIVCAYGDKALNTPGLWCYAPTGGGGWQSLTFNNNIGSSISVNTNGKMCVDGEYLTSDVNRCYTSFSSNNMI